MDPVTQTSAAIVPTPVGSLHVETAGSGPPAVLWHSLFVDSATWNRVRAPLAAERRLILIDGPNHGGSPPVRRPFTLEDCVESAVEVLDHLGIREPADWLGNAWGGHVKPLTDALLGPQARTEDPEGAALVAGGFRRAERRGMFDAIRWLSLHRPDLSPVLSQLETPALLTTNAADPMWTVAAARAAAGRLRHGALAVLPGSGHVGPLLQAAPDVVSLVTGFWRDPQAAVTQLAALGAAEG